MKEQLTRSIKTLGFSALAINGLIGAGIFALPAAAAESSGDFSPWMFVVCGLLMSTIILSFAQLATHYRGTGGPVLYAQEAFGPIVAFQTGWLMYVGRVSALAANSNALVIYLALLFPLFGSGLWHALALTTIILVLASSNLFGVRSAMGAINVLTVLKLIPLLLFVAFGLTWFDGARIFSMADAPLDHMSASLLLLVYAFVGFEGAVVPAGEAKNPRRDIPRALVQTLLFTVLLYFLIQSVSVSVLEDAASSTAPLSDAAGLMMGSWGAIMLTIAAMISITGNLAAIFFAAPRMTYALAIEKNLPPWFGRVSANSRVPANSIFFMTALALVLALTGSFVWLAIISSLARLVGFGICMAALLKLRIEQTAPSRVIIHAMLPGAALLICVWLAMQASGRAWLLTVGFMLLGAALFFLARRNRGELTASS